MKILQIAAVLAAVCLDLSAAPYEIGEELSREEFWKSDPVLFVGRHAECGFNFTSDEREGADSRQDGAVTCFGLPAYETRVSFGEKGGIERVEIMLYTAGGTEVFSEFTGADGRKFRRRERLENGREGSSMYCVKGEM